MHIHIHTHPGGKQPLKRGSGCWRDGSAFKSTGCSFRSWVQFPATTGWLTTIYDNGIWCPLLVYRQTCRQGTHIHKQINLKKKKPKRAFQYFITDGEGIHEVPSLEGLLAVVCWGGITPGKLPMLATNSFPPKLKQKKEVGREEMAQLKNLIVQIP